jgi:hypothetical protein
MRSRKPESTNLFDPEALRRLAEEEQPPNTEASTAGPWQVAKHAAGWAVTAAGREAPEVTARCRWVALLAAAALPAGGRAPRFGLADSPGGPPFPLLDRGEPAGEMATWSDELVAALNVLDAVASSPACLAFLLAAAGAEALERAGAIAAARLGADGESRDAHVDGGPLGEGGGGP